MKKNKMPIFYLLAVILFYFGCSLNGSPDSDQNRQSDSAKKLPSIPGISKTMVEDGRSFQVTDNPIISYSVHGHYSSDPAVAVIHDYRSGKDVLVLITSTDLVGVGNPSKAFPMNGVYLYTTYGENNLMTTWYEHGKSWITGGIADPVIQESDFSFWCNQKNCMFAPDIQFVEGINGGSSQIFLYIPDTDLKGDWRIGIAHANSGTLDNNGQYQLYDKFTADNSIIMNYFNFANGSGGNGFLIDPGVFYCSLQKQYYMLYVDTDYDHVNGGGNISIARMNYNDMRSGTNLGRIDFAPPYNKYSLLKGYLEGPDVSVMTNKYGMPNYYLVFTIGNIGIGYAMADPVAFGMNPTTCWNFKGLLFHDTGTFKGNHADLVQFNNKCYAFFHWSPYSSQSRSRQVCCKEFELNDKGEIIGVTIPANPSGDLSQYGTIDDTTKSITKGFVNIRDDSTGDAYKASVCISGLKNITGSPLSRFKLHYYLDIEPGSDLLVETGRLNNFFVSSPYLKHISNRTWAVVLDYQGSELNPGDMINAEYGDTIILHYNPGTSPATNKYFMVYYDKSNDFSQPVGNYNTWTTRIALRNGDDKLICGEEVKPDTDPAASRYFRNEWAPDNYGIYSYLTVMSMDENSGINSRYLDTGWTSQEWYIEDASGTLIMGTKKIVFAPNNSVRLRNKWTGNYYMTCNDKNDYKDKDGINYYWILNQAKHDKWVTQIWIKEAVDGKPGCFRLRSMWDGNDPNGNPPKVSPLYLTRDAKGDSSGVYCKYLHKDSGGHPDWTSQEWWIE